MTRNIPRPQRTVALATSAYRQRGIIDRIRTRRYHADETPYSTVRP